MDATRRAALNEAMARLARGDRAASEPVFQLLWPVLRDFSARWLPGSSAMEDVAQQVLLRVFSQAAHFDPAKDALSWALEIAVWECRTERRRVWRSKEGAWTPAAEGARAAAAAPDAAVEAQELQEALRGALQLLPEADRQALARALADEAGAGATERKRKQRALERLRAVWRRLHGNE